MENIKEFRETLLNKLINIDPDISNYISSEMYREDAISQESITIEWLIDKTLSILEIKSNTIGLILDSSLYDNYVDIDIFLSLYSFFQPKSFINFYNSLSKDHILHLNQIIFNEEFKSSTLHDILDWLLENFGDTYKDIHKIGTNLITTNDDTFNIYLQKLINLINNKDQLDDIDLENINVFKDWNLKLQMIQSNINHFFKISSNQDDDVLKIYLERWINNLRNIKWKELGLWYLNLLENIDNGDISSILQQEPKIIIIKKLDILKNYYNEFKKTTIGYPEYINNHKNDNLNSIQSKLYLYIEKIDPFLKIDNIISIINNINQNINNQE